MSDSNQNKFFGAIHFDRSLKFLTAVVDSYQEKIVIILIITVGLILIYYLLNFLIRRLIFFSLKLKEHINATNIPTERIKTLDSIFSSILKFLLFFSFFLALLKIFDIQLLPILTGAGFIGAAFIISFQGFIQDIIKGWVLIFEDQYRKGEWILVNNLFLGQVSALNLRTTILQDRNKSIHIIPNSQINFISNLSRHLNRTSLNLWFSQEKPFKDVKTKLEDNLTELIKTLDPDIRPVSFRVNGPKKFNQTEYSVEITFKSTYGQKDRILEQIRDFLINKKNAAELGLIREE
ncbi:MAG: mechanosensitive ion channel family protein [Patescibacteria group bacterium]|nr:mechanosensitive ion channel family protein [Patescibacteria group bacterium]